MQKKNNFKTDQENFWAGSFGNKYIDRNSDSQMIIDNIVFFSKILSKIKPINSVAEFGPNIGLNIMALKTIIPKAKFTGVEINKSAADKLKELKYIKVYNKSLFDFKSDEIFDFCFVKGVLIHQNPKLLNKAYKTLFKYSKKYILIAEYYNPTPVKVEYRGHKQKLFKRDFAGEFIKTFGNKIDLVDYGFAYHLDTFPQGDLTWFLFEKRNI
jgi:pseudaminic acid biosynthesis-associated methylase